MTQKKKIVSTDLLSVCSIRHHMIFHFIFIFFTDVCYNYYLIINEFNKDFIQEESLKSVVTDKSAVQSLTSL